MTRFGSFLSWEESAPAALLGRARAAERAGSDEPRQYVDAGYDEVYVRQIGPDQEPFFQFHVEDILPRLRQG